MALTFWGYSGCGWLRIANGCCTDEEKYNDKCYGTCQSLTGGSHPVRRDSCTCQLATKCLPGEEEFDILGVGLCYKDCKTLTGGSHVTRTGANTCQRAKRCQDNEEEHDGMCYAKCNDLSGGLHSTRTGENACKQNKKCLDDEEEYEGRCNRRAENSEPLFLQ